MAQNVSYLIRRSKKKLKKHGFHSGQNKIIICCPALLLVSTLLLHPAYISPINSYLRDSQCG